MGSVQYPSLSILTGLLFGNNLTNNEEIQEQKQKVKQQNWKDLEKSFGLGHEV